MLGSSGVFKAASDSLRNNRNLLRSARKLIMALGLIYYPPQYPKIKKYYYQKKNKNYRTTS